VAEIKPVPESPKEGKFSTIVKENEEKARQVILLTKFIVDKMFLL
jgi:hypothetical protein